MFYGKWRTQELKKKESKQAIIPQPSSTSSYSLAECEKPSTKMLESDGLEHIKARLYRYYYNKINK
jgi:hypothetical protein